MKKDEILKKTWIYSLGTQAAQAITLVASIVVRRILGPTQTGIWSALQVVVDYSKYSSMGVMDAVSREIPYHIGKGETDKAEKIKNLAFSFVLSSSGVLSLGALVFSFLLRNHLSPAVANGLFLISFVIFLQRFNNLLIALLRCYKHFEIETGLMVWSALVNAFLVAGCTYYFKIYGYILAMILSFVFNIVYVILRHRFNFRWNYDFGAIKPIISFGLPLMALSFINTILRTADRIIIAKWLGFQNLGYYSIALMATSYLSNFPIAFGIVLQPYYRESFGAKDDPTALGLFVAKNHRALLLILPSMIMAVWFFAPYGIRYFLPEFTQGIISMKILTLSIFFITIGQIYQDYLITVKKIVPLFIISGSGIGLAFLLNRIFLSQRWGIEGVAVIMAFIFLLTMTALCFSISLYTKHPGAAFKSLGLTSLSLLYLVSAGAWLSPMNETIPHWSFAKMFGFLVFHVPPFILLCREFNLHKFLSQKFSRKKVSG